MLSGPVTYEQIFALFSVLVVAGGVVAGFLAWVWRIVAALRKKYEADRTSLQAQIDDLEKDLADYKVHAAETFATKEGVSAAVGRVESAVDRLTGRIDRLLEAQASGSQPGRRTGG